MHFSWSCLRAVIIVIIIAIDWDTNGYYRHAVYAVCMASVVGNRRSMELLYRFDSHWPPARASIQAKRTSLIDPNLGL